MPTRSELHDKADQAKADFARSEQNLEALQRENEEQLKWIRRQEEQIKTLGNKIVKFERQWEFFGREKSCHITVPANGTPVVVLDGPWTHKCVREAFRILTKEVRRQIVQTRRQIESGQKYPTPPAKNADINQTEAESPPSEPQMAMSGGGQEKEVTDE